MAPRASRATTSRASTQPRNRQRAGRRVAPVSGRRGRAPGGLCPTLSRHRAPWSQRAPDRGRELGSCCLHAFPRLGRPDTLHGPSLRTMVPPQGRDARLLATRGGDWRIRHAHTRRGASQPARRGHSCAGGELSWRRRAGTAARAARRAAAWGRNAPRRPPDARKLSMRHPLTPSSRPPRPRARPLGSGRTKRRVTRPCPFVLRTCACACACAGAGGPPPGSIARERERERERAQRLAAAAGSGGRRRHAGRGAARPAARVLSKNNAAPSVVCRLSVCLCHEKVHRPAPPPRGPPCGWGLGRARSSPRYP